MSPDREPISSGATEPEGSGATDEVIGRVAERIHACVRDGCTPDVEALVAEHPGHEAQIRGLAQTLELLHAVEFGGSGGGRVPDAPGEPRPGIGRLGDYRLMREIGRGGMGVVYEAEQISLERRVALKVLPFAAVLDPKHLRRFKNEAQAAAHLQHQNIVPVHAVGCERGVHYFAMQLVEGATVAGLIGDLREMERSASPPAARAVDDTSSTLERIAPEHSTSTRSFVRAAAELGVQVAAGLEHAHDLGVVHRDVKPSNLLVDGRGRIWITDFGLARLESESSLTLTGELLGTVRYMSPEQASGRHSALDHRTDVYSLGATLYELLTLRPAFDAEDRRTLLEAIARDDPPAPSRLNPAIPTDLETIVLKAMAKEPESRYPTARELGADLQRFLDDQPILARRPDLADRALKWGRRHRQLVASVAVGLVLAVVGLSASTALIWREQHRTSRALADSEEDRALAEAVYEFMHETLTAFESGRGDITLRAVLDAAAETVDGGFPDRPLVEAEVRHMIQAMYFKLGEYALAESQAREMVDIRGRVLGPLAPETLEAKALLAQALRYRGATADAVRLYREVYESRVRALGREDPVTIGSLNNLVLGLREDGRSREALPLARRALERSRELLGERDHGTQTSMNNLALVLTELGELDEARPLYERALELARQAHGPDESWVAVLTHNLGRHYLDTGLPERAEPLLEELLDLQVRHQGPTHPGTISVLEGLAAVLRATGRGDEAERRLSETLDVARELHGDEHETTQRAREALIRFQQASGEADDLARAEVLLRDRLRVARAIAGEHHPQARQAAFDLAWHLGQQAKFAEAEERFLALVDANLEAGEEKTRPALEVACEYARMLERQHRVDEAIEWARGIVDDARSGLGEESKEALDYANWLGVLYLDHQRSEEAVELYGELLPAQRRRYGPTNANTIVATLNLGRALVRTGQDEEAHELLGQGVALAERSTSGGDRWLPDLRLELGTCSTRLGRYAEAEATLLAAHEALAGTDGPWRGRVELGLVALY